MMSADVTRMRGDYAVLMHVAEGLLDMIHRGQTCNAITFARMAQEAREAAQALASMIERTLFEDRPAPASHRRGVLDVLRGAVSRIVGAITGALAA